MTPRPSRRPTMADVGRLAGVSAATVSFVLNPDSDQSISQATRARVLQAVADLGYRPNRAARVLRRGSSGTLGVVVDESAVESPVGQILAGAYDAAAAGQHVLLTMFSGRATEILATCLETLVSHQVTGVLVLCSGTRTIDLPPAAYDVPALVVNGLDATGRLPAFVPDDRGGGAAAVATVLAAGHRDIGLLLGRAGVLATRDRLAGAQDAVAGFPDARLRVHYGNYYLDSGYALARELLDQPDPPTALVCGNDRMALGAYLAAGHLGRRIPDDVSVVGYDDTDPGIELLTPPLSTIRLPLYDMGRAAAAALLAGTAADLPAATALPCPPVPRGSVGPP
ncbi:MAG: LacI family transcriptional regulator [Austwickia sp.]|nr:LacI family transcriptional regulator [Actinomycetota bacterium]MCB1252454.1 LacI family DNA-binding transcriptional regulator [Austwickia sp.]MCO5309883.1 LacI family transcriptional regulator [Austwickia sp.]